MPHLFQSLSWLLGSFWGAKIVKTEQNLESVWKPSKQDFSNNLKILYIESNKHNQIQTMSHPSKGAVTLLGAKTQSKLSKMSKIFIFAMNSRVKFGW